MKEKSCLQEKVKRFLSIKAMKIFKLCISMIQMMFCLLALKKYSGMGQMLWNVPNLYEVQGMMWAVQLHPMVFGMKF